MPKEESGTTLKRQERGAACISAHLAQDLVEPVVVGKPPLLKQIMKLVPDHELNARLARNPAEGLAGIIKEKTPLEHLKDAWAQASPEERAAFLAEVIGR